MGLSCVNTFRSDAACARHIKRSCGTAHVAVALDIELAAGTLRHTMQPHLRQTLTRAFDLRPDGTRHSVAQTNDC